MLSTPLPADYPVPAALPAFVLQVLEEAVRSPGAATLGPLYTIIKGVGADLLQIVPPLKLIHLQDQLIKLLRNFDDHKVNLLCLAIFALLCSDRLVWPVGDDTSQASQTPKASAVGRSEDVCGAARLFFTSKAQKTLELVVLRAIMSCSSSMTPSDAISSLMSASEILDTVDTIERTNWVQKNVLKLRKLQEKVRNPNIDRTVRLVALEVIASLGEVKSLPDELVATIEGLLQRLPSGYDGKRIWKAYAASFTEVFMKSQISKVLRALAETDRSGMDFLIEMNNMRLFVGSMVEVVKTNLTVRQMLLAILSSNGIQDSIWRFLSCTRIQAKNTRKHGREEACTWHVHQVQWLLGRDLCLLLLKSAFFQSSRNLAIDPCLATSLLESATCVSVVDTTCNTFPPPRASFGLPVLVSSVKAHNPSETRCDQDWRTALKEDLDMDAAFRHELVIRRVNDVCRDVESRCNNAERPLKEEQKRSKDLEHELQTCKAECANLGVEAQENMLVLESLQTGQILLLDQKDSTEQRARELSEDLDRLRLKLMLVNQEAQNASDVAKEVLRQQELSHFAANTARDELLESEAQRNVSLERKVEQVELELRNIQGECEAVSVKLAEFHETINERDARITELENCATSYKVKSNHQVDMLRKKAGEMETLKGEVIQSRSEIEALTSKEKQNNDNFNLAMSDMQKEHEHEIAIRDAEILRQRSEHERADTALRKELATTLHETAILAEMRNTQIGELLGKIEILRTEREMRAKEFAEAQDLSGKLMALMGRNPGRPAATPLSVDVTDMKTNWVIETTREQDVQAVSQRSFGSSTSSKNNGSTPKRVRVQRTLTTPTVQPIESSTGRKTLRNTQTRRMEWARCPLEDLEFGTHNDVVVVRDQSRREQSKCETGSESCGKLFDEKENMLWQDMHEFSFADNHVFTGTDYHQAGNQIIEDASGAFDETTADF
ncbi:hypothetical protein MMC18_006741 [Xylographa bjoerkii]|nr:hypothetical protein [Xylographa bjoerkii]